jgi:protease II
MGRMWYENGKYLKKKHTFEDFIAVAEHLIKVCVLVCVCGWVGGGCCSAGAGFRRLTSG